MPPFFFPSPSPRFSVLALLILAGCKGSQIVPASANPTAIAATSVVEADDDPPEVAAGHRLFKETRFSQYFFAHSRGSRLSGRPSFRTGIRAGRGSSESLINQPLGEKGDPALRLSPALARSYPGPYAGKSMNCAACHLVDEHKETPGAGMRAYTDFARRSQIPARSDGLFQTPRNTPTMVNLAVKRDLALLLHLDGQFSSMENLVAATLTGRNFGWLADETATARAHVARVIREDNGQDEIAREYWGSYRELFAGENPLIPAKFKLPEEYRLKITPSTTDDEIFKHVVKLITVYANSLHFKVDEKNQYVGSPYDLFLKKNALPRKPSPGESALDYSRRLRGLIEHLASPSFVSESDGKFRFQRDAKFAFGPTELAGLRIFLAEPAQSSTRSGVGNCVACHSPPHFTDFSFHNTGASQEEYDSLHGNGAFQKVSIPELAERKLHPELYLPASAAHPRARGRFMSAPDQAKPELMDLGIWNMFANPDLAPHQETLRLALCAAIEAKPTSPDCTEAALLPQAIGLFKTPSLRNLGQSEPYLHTGQKDSIEQVLAFYFKVSELARQGKVRNSSSKIQAISIDGRDFAPLSAFLGSLNEDYH